MDSLDLRGKRIFITGGTGYLGSLLLSKLKGSAAVVALSRNPDGFRERHPELLWDDLSFLKGDIEDFRFQSGSSFDFVIHGGNPADLPSDSNGQLAFRKNVIQGTTNLLTQIETLTALPRRILLMSSGAVYGPQPSEIAASAEDRAPIPGDLYAEAKREAEAVVTEFARSHGIGAVVARIFACAGPYLPLTGRFALGQFLASARERGAIRVLSDGTPKRSYLAGGELAEWILTLLVGRSGLVNEIETFNVGSDDAVTIREVAETVRDVFSAHGKKITLEIGAPDPSKPQSPSYVPEIRKISEKYDLRPKKSSIQAVREATEWALNEA